MEDDRVLIRVIDRETGAPVTIARLTYRTRIDEVMGIGQQIDSLLFVCVLIMRTRPQFPRTLVAVDVEGSLYVTVSEKSDGNHSQGQSFGGVRHGDHVLIFIDWRSMYKLNVRGFRCANWA